jgi:hypothetical protein
MQMTAMSAWFNAFSQPPIQEWNVMFRTTALLACCSMIGCAQPALAPDNSLARVARADLCCAVSLSTQGISQSEATGCGQRATYVREGSAWRRAGKIEPGPGLAADKLPVCTN